MDQTKELTVIKKENGIDVFFSASVENIDKAGDETERFLDSSGFGGHSFGVLLVMREALNNAVLHGCKGDPQKRVCYTVRIESGYLVIEVEDNGHGFDWRPSLKGELPPIEESGRGIHIMKEYVTTMDYNEKGNILVLRIEIETS